MLRATNNQGDDELEEAEEMLAASGGRYTATGMMDRGDQEETNGTGASGKVAKDGDDLLACLKCK